MLYKFSQKVIPLAKRIIKTPEPNARGERDIEYSWVLQHFPQQGGEILDFGCGDTFLLPLFAARQGFKVTAIDLKRHVPWSYEHPNLKFIQGDIFDMRFEPEQFDFIINCSSVEHVGLQGRYDIRLGRPDGDLEAMGILKSILKAGRQMILTVPVGRDMIFTPFHRVYGIDRLRRLLDGWMVKAKEYWTKNVSRAWQCVDEASALNTEPTEFFYSLGLFVLQEDHG